MQTGLIRKIAERGLARAQEKLDSENVDIYQHILDELEKSEEDQMRLFIERIWKDHGKG